MADCSNVTKLGDDFADLLDFEEITAGVSPKGVTAEDLSYGYAGREVEVEQLGGEWSFSPNHFSPDDLDSLARLGAMYQPLPVV